MTRALRITTTFDAYSSGAVSAGTIKEFVSPCAGTINAVEANAATAGTGAGSTRLQVLVNGVDVYQDVATNAPSLLAASTGRFSTVAPPAARAAVKAGDLITLGTASVSTTGHARLAFSIGLTP